MTINAKEKFKNVKCVLFDLDGTIYLGKKVFPFTNKVLKYLIDEGLQYCFLTNNSSLSNEDYKKKFRDMKIDCLDNGIYTSGDAAIEFLHKNYKNKKIQLLATKSLEKQFTANDIILSSENPELVVIAFDTELTFEKLTAVCNNINKGVPYIATHPDNFCPAENGILPDAGSFIALIEKATGVSPLEICGKPGRIMADGICKKFSLKAEELLMVGDRINTDIAFGVNNGMHTLMVLTGENTIKSLTSSAVYPEVIARDIEALIDIF